jgi:hypothetical protein
MVEALCLVDRLWLDQRGFLDIPVKSTGPARDLVKPPPVLLEKAREKAFPVRRFWKAFHPISRAVL